MRKSWPLSENRIQTYRTTLIQASGLVGISLIMLQSLVSSTSLDTPQLISLIAFSVAIPLLVCFILAIQYETLFKCVITFWYNVRLVLYITGFVSVIVGVDAILWHSSRIAAYVFIGVSLLAFGVILGYILEDEFDFQENRTSSKSNTDTSKK